MADRLIVVMTRNTPANILALETTAPVPGGWGRPGYRERNGIPDAFAMWGVWSSAITPATRQGLETLRLAGTHRVQIWDDAGLERHDQFAERVRLDASSGVV